MHAVLATRRRSRVLLITVVLFLFQLSQRTLPSWNLGFGPSLFSTSRSKVRFKPSSFDWSDARLFFPPHATTPLPRGRPKTFPRVQSPSTPLQETSETQERRAAVKDAFVRSWSAYKAQAWAWDELLPASGGGKNTFGGWAATLVDSLDTLWIMGCVYC